ncbi:DMT family transporter [Rubellicoccus peritrichatus]|uniref:DMT family transporter n=1 Tax=Rubellicoccus peritrichatus TaxID=3080537 RepID=A0AAQ3QUD3_9BACT|nr:DMT family transporter [Puniceicoccus sp. CR14]WOO42271.1 DMT family transporter [Puniceicoccus sp. CR14]
MTIPTKIGILLLGVFACSTSVLWIKLTTVDPILLATYRMLAAALILSPVFFRARKRHRDAFGSKELRRCLWPGILLAAHFITWIIGARLTWAANSSLIVNVIPVAMPFLLYFAVGERITRGEILGTVIAIGGVVVLALESYQLDSKLLMGDLICAGSMLLFAIYLMLGRKNRDFANLWLYVVPVYAIGGIVCLLVAIPLANFSTEVPAIQWVYVAGLTIVPTIFGHSLLNWGMKHLRGQLVAIVNLAQFIFAGTMGAIFLDEIPGGMFVLAAGLVVAGAITAIKTQPQEKG